MRHKEPVDSKRAAFRRSLSAAVLRHARYLAVLDDKSATKHLVDRRREDWQLMERKKARLQASSGLQETGKS